MKIIATPPTLVLTHVDFRTQTFLFRDTHLNWAGGVCVCVCSGTMAKFLILFIHFLRDEVSMDSLSYLRKCVYYVNSLQRKTNMWKCYCHFL